MELAQCELDYIHIGKLIHYVNGRSGTTVSPEEAAADTGLSREDLAALIARWAGVTQEVFLESLGHMTGNEIRRAQLPTGEDATGPSGDTIVSLERINPGDHPKIKYSFHPTRFGRAVICTTERGICGISFVERGNEAGGLAYHRSRWPRSEFVADDTAAADYADRIFMAEDTATAESGIRCLVKGTAFQYGVWQALLSIPPGSVTSYGALAAIAGNPGAVRAVGNAVGANPIAYLIPCHRVVRASGKLGGYRWGTLRKQAMLAREIALSRSGLVHAR